MLSALPLRRPAPAPGAGLAALLGAPRPCGPVPRDRAARRAVGGVRPVVRPGAPRQTGALPPGAAGRAAAVWAAAGVPAADAAPPA
ncbi:hypothetical protein [Patulibacter sp. SYSU D01012]|uniref:hypothetical protein n=1 Tax=Patulibacter sp. SYSU D01012 TaxID=2817381 RepID=UPI001B3049A7|nr:hypothetical protein [Patulibacter sp. SYSU D01012]